MFVIDGVIVVGAIVVAISISYAMLRRPHSTSSTVPITTPIALVIAHPDDESMFFVPTLTNLCTYAMTHIICLSTGDSAGLGRIRSKELAAAAQVLQASPTPAIINDDHLPDGMDHDWPADVIRNHVDSYLRTHNIKSIITFDDYGVSGHPNHISVSKALSQNPPDGVNVYVLESLPIWRKYIGALSFLFEASRIQPSDVVFVASKPWLSYRAMKQHWSQFVWFRLLFVIFSSYTFVNRLRRINS